MNEEKPQDLQPNVLTCIHSTYTLAATHERNEVDDLIVKQFLATLAEIALSIASRKVAE